MGGPLGFGTHVTGPKRRAKKRPFTPEQLEARKVRREEHRTALAKEKPYWATSGPSPTTE